MRTSEELNTTAASNSSREANTVAEVVEEGAELVVEVVVVDVVGVVDGITVNGEKVDVVVEVARAVAVRRVVGGMVGVMVT